MAPDIRSFFGGGGPAQPAPKKETNGSKPGKKQRNRKVVSDDSDDEVVEVKTKMDISKKAKKEAMEPKVEETTSSDYFASKGKAKPLRSTPLRPKKAAPVAATPTKASNGSAHSAGRNSARKAATKSYAEDDDEDIARLLDDDKEGDQDIFAEDFKKSGRLAGDDYEESGDDLPLSSKPKTQEKIKGTKGRKKKIQSEDEDGDIEMAEIPVYDGGADPKRKRGSVGSSTASRKRKSISFDDNEEDDFLDDDDDEPKKKSRKTAAKGTASKPRAPAKKEVKEESTEMKAIFDAIPTVRAPTPPPRDENKKFSYKFNGGNASVDPMDPGSKEIPTGEENCLAGLNFVFTGVLQSIGREEGQSLVKRYGGKVTTGPSSKTSYVVLGDDAGPKKLETIAKLKIKTIKEDGLFELIRRLPANGGDGLAAEKHAEKKAADLEKIRKDAEEMEAKDKANAKEAAKAQKLAAAKAGAGTNVRPPPKPIDPDSRLWVDKYSPDNTGAVCGNKGQVEKLQNWLRKWHDNAKYDFKKAGADGNGIYRAIMLHGPPGIGKTTAAHLVAKLEGFDVVESNASDTRSKKLVETGLRGVLDTTSLLGFFAGDGKKVDAGKKKLVLIMDEVDGMSAGDRGGVGALAAVAKKTSIPMILICNERRLPKMKPFDNVTADLPFRRPTVDQIRGRIMTICFREGFKLPPQVVDALIEGSHADIRQIINMISTAKLDAQSMDYNDGKAMAKAWEKHIILKPWDIVSKILRPQMFAKSSTATLNEKIELYFNDHEFSSLMLQENYLKTQPSLMSEVQGAKARKLKALELAEKAANAISSGDLVDRMIHGTQQQWSLMPTHAVFSFVTPASYIYGNFTERTGFTTWLGMNSKQGKLSRFIKEIQGHMRLRASGDRHEVRQQYLPALWNKTVKLLQDDGKEAVQEVMDFMDSYYLTKDDYDAILELGVGPMDMESVKLDTQTKATFTRMYNAASHPMPFMKASTVSAGLAAKTAKAKPDLEDAIEESEDEAAVAEAEAADEEEDGEIDLKKDKYIKAPKKKKAPAKKDGGAKGKGKGKAKAADEDDDEDDSEEDVKPEKKASATRGGKRGGRGRGK